MSRYENEIVKPSYEFFWAIHNICGVNLNCLIEEGIVANYMKPTESKRKHLSEHFKYVTCVTMSKTPITTLAIRAFNTMCARQGHILK